MSKIRQQIDIPLRPEQVWQTLRYPEYMELWNPKCVECRGLGRESRVGDRFPAKFQMRPGARVNECECEVVEIVPTEKIVTRYYTQQPVGYTEETISLEARKGGAVTRVAQFLDLRHSGIPKWALWVIGFIARFGKPRGDGVPLQELRDVCLAQAGMNQ